VKVGKPYFFAHQRFVNQRNTPPPFHEILPPGFGHGLLPFIGIRSSGFLRPSSLKTPMIKAQRTTRQNQSRAKATFKNLSPMAEDVLLLFF
jgi:hypothetical protein